MIFAERVNVRTLLVVFFVLSSMLSFVAKAQSKPSAFDPVAEVRASKSWEYGPFINVGNGVADRSDFHFFWVGFQVGKPVTPVLKAGILSGQFELGAEVTPFFQAYTPAPVTKVGILNGVPGIYTMGGGTYTGVSVAPVIFRWNFATHTKRFQPWLQAKGAVLYTTHKFPPDYFVTPGEPGGTSVWNFEPQGGIGFHYFTREKRSIDVGLNAVHISSASLGDKNPGVNASLQLQVGYSFWK
jgi:hypothetical protein